MSLFTPVKCNQEKLPYMGKLMHLVFIIENSCCTSKTENIIIIRKKAKADQENQEVGDHCQK